jgi:hypothetical protein
VHCEPDAKEGSLQDVRPEGLRWAPADLAPDNLAAYRAEAEAFSRIDLQDLADTAAEEYPEYNGGVA